jgi:hypothetical protein
MSGTPEEERRSQNYCRMLALESCGYAIFEYKSLGAVN